MLRVKIDEVTTCLAPIQKIAPALEGEDALDKVFAQQRVAQVARRGGSGAANRQWRLFLDDRLDAYPEARNQPEQHGSSELSPYLRHGQISAHQLFHDLAEQQDWSLQRLGPKPTGQRNGWWGMSVAEAFLDELVTWRELGYNMTVHRPDYREYEALPDWAKISLAKHAGDIRPVVYDLDQFDRAWGPERPIFGKIRYMSSENTARKYAVKNYIHQYQG